MNKQTKEAYTYTYIRVYVKVIVGVACMARLFKKSKSNITRYTIDY